MSRGVVCAWRGDGGGLPSQYHRETCSFHMARSPSPALKFVDFPFEPVPETKSLLRKSDSPSKGMHVLHIAVGVLFCRTRFSLVRIRDLLTKEILGWGWGPKWILSVFQPFKETERQDVWDWVGTMISNVSPLSSSANVEASSCLLTKLCNDYHPVSMALSKLGIKLTSGVMSLLFGAVDVNDFASYTPVGQHICLDTLDITQSLSQVTIKQLSPEELARCAAQNMWA